jgi:hypothetical protein
MDTAVDTSLLAYVVLGWQMMAYIELLKVAELLAIAGESGRGWQRLT